MILLKLKIMIKYNKFKEGILDQIKFINQIILKINKTLMKKKITRLISKQNHFLVLKTLMNQNLILIFNFLIHLNIRTWKLIKICKIFGKKLKIYSTIIKILQINLLVNNKGLFSKISFKFYKK